MNHTNNDCDPIVFTLMIIKQNNQIIELLDTIIHQNELIMQIMEEMEEKVNKLS